ADGDFLLRKYDDFDGRRNLRVEVGKFPSVRAPHLIVSKRNQLVKTQRRRLLNDGTATISSVMATIDSSHYYWFRHLCRILATCH
ncbi:hypothetical protein, partial [Neisseria sp. P0019.S003]|uniref:hypothetical protein n=1 Tax=Neisseria sp. P0019.S003 TaxID=3436799 RepID=UPI003F7EF994